MGADETTSAAMGGPLTSAHPPRQITTRRVSFRWPEDLPRHFAGDDLVMSHVVAVLSAMFPNGEDFFVQSVRYYRDRIDDPELKRQVARFIGQEALHGREHRAFNDRLGSLGYATRYVDRSVDVVLNRFAARRLPPAVQLAITAALEHYTATLAEVLMSSEEARATLSDDEVRHLLVWHAVEESEHKSVAFDVYQAVCGDQRLRHLVMNLVTVGFLAGVVDGTLRSLRRDPASRDRSRLWASLRRAARSPFLSRQVRARIRDYNRRGFHPDDHDCSALLDRWRQELFGPGGPLADRVVQDRAARAGALSAVS